MSREPETDNELYTLRLRGERGENRKNSNDDDDVEEIVGRERSIWTSTDGQVLSSHLSFHGVRELTLAITRRVLRCHEFFNHRFLLRGLVNVDSLFRIKLGTELTQLRVRYRIILEEGILILGILISILLEFRIFCQNFVCWEH
ncbi:hypothetical protein Mapa_013035 [Marchantia paleacea]|nr:hypothetical protein Mapa_013035 [Marchantia paleacea]